MTDEPETEDEQCEAEAVQEHRERERIERKSYEDEMQSLPVLLVGIIPLLICGGVIMSILGLKSHWWWTGMMAIPVLAWITYPFLLRARMKTPLRLSGGRMVVGRAKWKLLAIGALAVIAFQFLQLAYSWWLAG